MANARSKRSDSLKAWLPFISATGAIVVLLLGSNLPTPIFPIYGREFGLSPFGITLVFATYALSVIPSLILFAPLSDTKGRRTVLIAATIAAAAAAGLFAAANGAIWLFAAQALQALALGALQGTAAPTLVETSPRKNVRQATSIASTATLGGAAAGPLLAGLLAQYAPLSPRLSYLVEVVALLVGTVSSPSVSKRRPLESIRKPMVQIPKLARRTCAMSRLRC